MAFPDFFSSPLHLPFNGECLKGRFVPAPHDTDPGGEGALVLLRGSELLVHWTGDGPSLPLGMAPEGGVYIGTWDGLPCRIAEWKEPLPQGWAAESLLASEPRVNIDFLSLGGVAGQILHWMGGSAFCSRCGAPAAFFSGEWGKRCGGCGYEHYPHIHPCVIVLVRRPGEVLLTRKANWPAGRYSLVAGFLDFGECLEEAVVREVREETGVEIANVRYVGSQSWPFPSQVMAGFIADYTGGEVRVEEAELEDARWFAVDALPALPPRRSIARFILDHHLKE